MKRLMTVALAAALAVAVFSASGCQKKVEVKTGTRVVCTYGHVISDNTKVANVPAKDVAKYGVRTVTRICEQHAKLEALYKQAQDALKAGDLSAAKKALASVVAIDKAYGKAQDQLDQIASGKKPKPDQNPPSAGDAGTSSPSGGANAAPGGSGAAPATETPGGNTSGPIDGLRRWTPDTLKGYTASKPTVDALTIARQYIPADGSNALTLVIVTEQYRTADDAKNGLSRQLTSRYTEDRETVTINGHSAKYGTDGKRFAALGFTEGAVMVAMEMSVKSGSPSTLRTAILDVAKQLP